MASKEDAHRLSPNYIIIPMITAVAAGIAGYFSRSGALWYDTLILPSYTPPGYVFSFIWLFIYITTAAVAIAVWNDLKRDRFFTHVFILFGLNVFFNVFYTYLFFRLHYFIPAIIDAALVSLTMWVIFVILIRRNQQIALLLIPYAAWGMFATYLTFDVWLLNT